jgi:PAS domain S-box-containing protein
MVGMKTSGQTALVNAQLNRVFGYRRAELIGQPVGSWVPDAIRTVHPRLRARHEVQERTRGSAIKAGEIT